MTLPPAWAVFSTASKADARDYDKVYVIETKGLHLKDNDKTTYITKLFDICTREAEARHWNELSLQMKDKIMRFEVLSEADWEERLNKLIHG